MADRTSYTMTPESMEAFINERREEGLSSGRLTACIGYLAAFYEFLPEGKEADMESYLDFRAALLEKGYAKETVYRFMSCLNRYAAFMGCEELAGRKTMADLRGREFGYLTVIKPLEKRNRGDVVWQCRCRCGKECEATTSLLLNGFKKSCGCLRAAQMQRVNQFIDGTSIRMSLDDRTVSETNQSGYIGVSPKRDRWQAYIRFQGKHRSLGTYKDLREAVKARSRGKEEVIEEATELKKVYDRVQKPLDDMPHPQQRKTPKPVLLSAEKKPLRSDNTSGHPGVTKRRGKWIARITRNGVTRYLGESEDLEQAIALRIAAEKEGQAS